jgi:hypothetical protein
MAKHYELGGTVADFQDVRNQPLVGVITSIKASLRAAAKSKVALKKE